MNLKKPVRKAGVIWLGMGTSEETLANTVMSRTADSGSDSSKTIST
jgi:hypothetical protein